MKSELKKQVQNRLRRLEGQMRGLQKMVAHDTYCIDIINQTSAVKKAISGVENVLLKNHLETCVVDQVREGNHQMARNEILKVYSLKRS